MRFKTEGGGFVLFYVTERHWCVCMHTVLYVHALTRPTLEGNQDVLGCFRAGIMSKHWTRHRNLASSPILALRQHFLLRYKNKLRPTLRASRTIKWHNRQTFLYYCSTHLSCIKPVRRWWTCILCFRPWRLRLCLRWGTSADSGFVVHKMQTK